MLVQNPTITAGDVITIKFTSGEETISTYAGLTADGKLSISKPMSLINTPTGPGLAPWCFSADPNKTMSVNTSTVIFYGKTEKDIAASYSNATSPIQKPSAAESLILTGKK